MPCALVLVGLERYRNLLFDVCSCCTNWIGGETDITFDCSILYVDPHRAQPLPILPPSEERVTRDNLLQLILNIMNPSESELRYIQHPGQVATVSSESAIGLFMIDRSVSAGDPVIPGLRKSVRYYTTGDPSTKCQSAHFTSLGKSISIQLKKKIPCRVAKTACTDSSSYRSSVSSAYRSADLPAV